ncbi:LysM peptidoglycan-binding domain-containing protein [Mesonia sp. HuA40]|uniref:LysM peptidoglycan-binding domain-containing protein n=1 Tax=Mesonia sp. HuA40 TaxID=2602761 RepID=UPI0011C85462|nr:LysM peptidoglycan-binding domain-containing protein [Mesonia sp. HuA40]TXK71611.1 hypothetical protein FT993_09430 [Mesonia sp. HuA40]
MKSFLFNKNKGVCLFDFEQTTAESNAQAIQNMRNLLNIHKMSIHDLNLELADGILTVYGEVNCQKTKEIVILLLGNAKGIACVNDKMSLYQELTNGPANANKPSQFYEITPTDNLKKIAKRFYGDESYIDKIINANKPLLTGPTDVFSGLVIRIPN